jgi:acetyl-CoA acyltransferase
MSEIFIAGVSMTRFGPQPRESITSLSAHALRDCLENAGAAVNQVGAVYFASMSHSNPHCSDFGAAEIAWKGNGLSHTPIVDVANGCAGGGTAFWLARNHLLSGESEIVLAIGAERSPISRNTWPVTDSNTSRCRAHMARYGTTNRQLAMISSKNHSNSVLNSKCHNQQVFSVEEVLASRLVAYPLTAPMCAPLSNGSAAALLCTRKGLRQLQGSKKAVRVDSCVLKTEAQRGRDNIADHLIFSTASGAYAQAGIGPEDVDFAEVHDSTSFDELLATELLGFCEEGAGGRFAQSGAGALSGRLPVNPSGGLESRGHPMGATGLAQIYELVLQLRNEADPRQIEKPLVALQENHGELPGTGENVSVVSVLSR